MISINDVIVIEYYILIMIKLIQHGSYKLIETKSQAKILTLDEKNTYVWLFAKKIGEILVTSHNPHKADHTLTVGKYRIYNIKDEPKLTDLVHLELLVGDGVWQGYLLPTGLPADIKKRARIVPTKEIITKSVH